MKRTVPVLFGLLASLAACDGELLDDVGVVVAPMHGAAFNGTQAGIVRVTVNGQSDTHTGLLVAPGLTLTSRSWVDYATAASAVTMTSGPGTLTAQTRVGAYINANSFVAATIVQHHDFLDGHAVTPTIDLRDDVSLVNVALRCYEYRNDTLLWAPMRVGGTNADGTLTLLVDSTDKYVEQADAGSVCMDEAAHTAVGMVTGLVGGQARILRYKALLPWINGIRNLAATRNDGRSTRVSLYTLGPQGQQMCLDIPYGSHYERTPLNIYPCHLGPAQRFWFDYRVDVNNPRMVSDASGLCIDVPDASTVAGRDMQQSNCHAGANQRFQFSVYNDAVGGYRIRPTQALAQNLCLAVEGGTSATTRVTEQAVCNGLINQRWFPIGLP